MFEKIRFTDSVEDVSVELAFLEYALNEHAIVSIANAAGNITYVNEKFCDISGYSRQELIGKNHKIVKSEEHSDAFFVDMWKTISSGRTWHGEIKNINKTGNPYWVKTTIIPNLNEKGKPYQYLGIRTEITERKETEQKLERIAYYDLLTDLPNRVLITDRLSQAMLQCHRRNRSLAIAFLDLDSFKDINDLHGHDVGNQVLITVSQRMKEALREGDSLARIGGDEFIALMGDLETDEGCELVLKRLLAISSDPIAIGNAKIQISTSIGVTLYPKDGVDAEQLIRHANQAMYTAKKIGKSRYHFFDSQLDKESSLRLEDIDDIRSALERREFVLHYQPKVNMHTGAVIGAEALIRWQHPVRGLVPPLKFLPVIEGHDISLDLGEWVIETALSQINHWRTLGLNLVVSVNISAYQLQQINFVQRLEALLAAYPEVDPNFLVLEILETGALSNINQVSATMDACNEMGVRFALDDFGTGYSSLTHLRRLPAYLIKIDQSFVRDMLEDCNDFAIVNGVIGLAKTFKREVVAEGVETIAHGTALLQLGCELAQGYGIARPMPAADIPDWVASWIPDDVWREERQIKTS